MATHLLPWEKNMALCSALWLDLDYLVNIMDILCLGSLWFCQGICRCMCDDRKKRTTLLSNYFEYPGLGILIV